MTVREVLASIQGGRVLDVATGSGGFVETLIGGLQQFDEIVGIDIDDRGSKGFSEAFGDRPNVRFEQRDALDPALGSGSWNTVAVSNSLHHFADPEAVLRRMVELLRPGGHLILSEMYRDGQDEAAMTHVKLHHWAAAVDRSHGTTHRETYTRDEMLRMVGALGLRQVAALDVEDLATQPMAPDVVSATDSSIDRIAARTDGNEALIRQGEDVRRHLHLYGVRGATALFVMATNRLAD